jgi:redox-sensitive bicupin YhaK (pirin superfamily)
MHRDSLGSVQEIRPGAVNWMTAGQGIVHSERSPAFDRATEAAIHGIQTWVALPTEYEEIGPWFRHYAAVDIPRWTEGGVHIALIAGQFGDRTSPVEVFSPILYLDLQFSAFSQFTLPSLYSEQAIYAIDSGLNVADTPLPPYRLAELTTGQSIRLAATRAVRCIVIGGEPLGTRYKWWNFVSSRPERIEQAKADWRSDRFQAVPGETECIPLPDHVQEANPL